MKKFNFINIKSGLGILITILTTSIFVCQTDLTIAVSAEKAMSEKTLNGSAAIEYLKQTGGYDSLKTSFEAINLNETGNSVPQSPAATEIQKLNAPDGAMNDEFGGRVAVSGNTALIGAIFDGSGSIPLHGSVYVFIRNGSTWTFQQRLFASDRGSGDWFGWSVAISGDTAIVGAMNDDIGTNSFQGSAYVFVRNGTTWTEQQKLTASDGAASDSFGSGVGVSGNTVIVGAGRDDNGGNTDQGSAYIFVRNGTAWTEQQKLSDINGELEDRFGWSVAIAGETVIIGADDDNIGHGLEGSASVYTRNGTTWTFQQLLTANDTTNVRHFGFSVAIDDETAVIGAYATRVGANSSQGAAFVFVRNSTTWTKQQKLTASDGGESDSFGISVGISDETIVVGSPFHQVGANFAQGAAYTFTRSGTIWTEQQKLTVSDGAVNDFFARSVGISDGMVIGGAPSDNVGTVSDQGSAYVFTTNSTPTAHRPFDFDGDGKSDVSVFRPSDGAWYINQSTAGFTGYTFGFGTDLLVPADFDGDGKTDVAVFRNGAWYYLQSSDGAFKAAIFGQAGDLPRPADFDGDGKADINVFRPSNGAWYRLNSSNGAFVGNTFGQNGDQPLIADFDGDGKSDIAVFRPMAAAAFYWLESSTGTFKATAFGISTDIPTMGDFDGDGKTDIAVFRPNGGAWYRYNSSNGAFFGMAFGQNGDIPVAADFDGDGKTDIAVFRPNGGTWYYLQSSNGGFVGLGFGISTDKPIPAAFQ